MAILERQKTLALTQQCLAGAASTSTPGGAPFAVDSVIPSGSAQQGELILHLSGLVFRV